MIVLIAILSSTLLYLFLHYKTLISLKFLYLDNLAVIICASILSWSVSSLFSLRIWSYILTPIFVAILMFSMIMIRFWRTPVRKIQANSDEIVSPADGRVISVQHFNAGEIPETAKNRIKSRLEEFSGSELLANPFRMISINMTLLDVHKNCAPLSGEIILNKHTSGKFLSLKNERSLSENERNSYIIQSKDPNIIIGIVQIASRLVRRIDSYVKSGEQVNQGDWLGMIRFGSQVDVILPSTCQVLVSEGMQVYAAKTVIAEVVREEI